MLFINDWDTVLSNDLGKTETSAEIESSYYDLLEDIDGDDYYPAVLWNGSSYEYVHIVAKEGSNTVTLERAKEGSSAISCPLGSKLSIVNTAEVYQNLNQKESGLQMNKNAVTSDTEIPDGYNALSVGPLDIEATVTVNGVWEVL
jgi:hypothetical protein